MTRRNAELVRINDTKEQIIALLSKDLKNPASNYSAQLEQLSAEAAALTAAQIAERLFLSVHTVNTHRQRIYAKMDVRNVSDIIHKGQARRAGYEKKGRTFARPFPMICVIIRIRNNSWRCCKRYLKPSCG